MPFTSSLEDTSIHTVSATLAGVTCPEGAHSPLEEMQQRPKTTQELMAGPEPPPPPTEHNGVVGCVWQV